MANTKESDLPSNGPHVDQEEDFAALFEASNRADKDALRHDAKISGNIVSIGDEWVFVDIGGKTEGAISKQELLDSNRVLDLKVGDSITAYVIAQRDGDILLSVKMTQAASEDAVRAAYRSGVPVEGLVMEEKKGGYSVLVFGRQCFCPYSQIDIVSGGLPDDYIGKKFFFRITEFSEKGRNIVLSRRQTLEEERNKKVEELQKTLNVGDIVSGTVRKLAPFGAFVDIGGIEGLVPMSELAWSRVESVSDVLTSGEEISVKITTIDWEKRRIGLSLKQARDNPWDTVSSRFHEGFETVGTVTRLANFGAFVELEPGIEGLLHISNLGRGRRINHPRETLSPGESVKVRVISISPTEKRLGLDLVADVQDFAPGNTPDEITEGSVVHGEIQAVKDYGLFVNLPGGRTGLLRNAEIGDFSPRELRKKFPLGSMLDVKIISIDSETNKIALSIKALERTNELSHIQEYLKSGNVKKSFGTFGELLKLKLGQKD
ncbi:MAG: S1 RNA-binding domain-containing protein [Desulfomonilaceae bacterium]|jgi:small subunit ribosomal protein S1